MTWKEEWALFKQETGLDPEAVPVWERTPIYQTFVNWEEWKRGKAICECGESELSHDVPLGFVLPGFFGPAGPALRLGSGSRCLLDTCRCRQFRPVERPPWLKANPKEVEPCSEISPHIS